AYRNQLVRTGARSGTTVSVNWPFWEEGGIGGTAVRENLRTLGLAPLDTPRALTALRHAMTPEDTSPTRSRLTVLVGGREELKARFAGDQEEPPGESATDPARDTSTAAPVTGTDPVAPPDDVAGQALVEEATGHLRRLVASSLKLDPERLSPDAALERYGMDSVIAVGVIAEL
ncbi:acyl carrier protein, partial [Saccharothrix sp. ST-888]|uniref:acyl carrier protein n=1 Tax=Saccharothrix sp. ST-888 TaxID=1427391 RepID=UPI0005ECC684